MAVRPAIPFTLAFVFGTFSSVTAVRAANDEPPLEQGHEPAVFELGLQAYALVTFGNICSAAGDVVTCQTGVSAIGLAIMPRFRLMRPLSVGLLAAYGTKPASEAIVSSDGAVAEFTTRFWRLAAEGRLHPFDSNGTDVWFAAEAGVAALTDRIESLQPPQSSALKSKTQYAPSIGAAVGVDFYVLPRVALGVEARGLIVFFEAGDPPPNQSDISVDKRYGSQPGLWIALTGTIIPAL